MSGEKPGRRDQIDRFVRDMVKRGNDPRYAERKARECALRADRRDENPKRKNPKN